MLTKSRKSIIAILTITVVALLAVGMCGCAKKSSSSSSSNSNKSTNTNFSADNFKQTDKVEITIKNYGKVTVGLDANQAPITVQNFKSLVEQGFYNGLTFHRIIDKFMAQGGDPKGDGTGGSEKTIKGEFIENGVNNTLAHTRGAISMARSQDNNSASSQFFIVHQTSSNNSQSLDGKYCCFGYVQEGMDVIDKMIADAHPTDNNGTIAKANQPIIESIKIV